MTVYIPRARPAIPASKAGWVPLTNTKKDTITAFKMGEADLPAASSGSDSGSGSAAAALQYVDPNAPGKESAGTEALLAAASEGVTTMTITVPDAPAQPAAEPAAPVVEASPATEAAPAADSAVTEVSPPAEPAVVESPPSPEQPAPAVGGGCPDPDATLAAINAVRAQYG